MPKVKRRVDLPEIKVIKVRGMPRVENDPVFIKKFEQAQEFLRKNGLPKDLEKRRRK